MLTMVKGKVKAKSKLTLNSFDTLKYVDAINKDRKVVCFHSGKPGHWKKRCKTFLAYKKKNVASTSKGM